MNIHQQIAHQLQQRLKPGQAISCASLIQAARLELAQAENLLEASWSTPTELRQALRDIKRGEQPEAGRAATPGPSHDSLVQATEMLWVKHRADGGKSPTRYQVKALAHRLDARRSQGASKVDEVKAISKGAPKLEKLKGAREVLAQAHKKVSGVRFSGRAKVKITFNETGNIATVPGSQPGFGPYTVKLTAEGVSYDCGCSQGAERGLRCEHMIAARTAWLICKRAPEIKLSAYVRLDPSKVSKNSPQSPVMNKEGHDHQEDAHHAQGVGDSVASRAPKARCNAEGSRTTDGANSHCGQERRTRHCGRVDHSTVRANVGCAAAQEGSRGESARTRRGVVCVVPLARLGATSVGRSGGDQYGVSVSNRIRASNGYPGSFEGHVVSSSG